MFSDSEDFPLENQEVPLLEDYEFFDTNERNQSIKALS
jgi:hypothetical protein